MKTLVRTRWARPSRWLWLALLCALVLTQSLGLVHQIIHSPAQHARMGANIHQTLAQNQIQNAGHADDDAHADHHGYTHDHDHAQGYAHNANWLSTFFAGHGEVSDCRLHDALSAFDAHVLANVNVIPSLLASIYIAFSRITATARAAALYDARGPPATL